MTIDKAHTESIYGRCKRGLAWGHTSHIRGVCYKAVARGDHDLPPLLERKFAFLSVDNSSKLLICASRLAVRFGGSSSVGGEIAVLPRLGS